MNLTKRLQRSERLALTYGTKQWTYRQLIDEMEHVAAALRSLKEQVIVLPFGNDPLTLIFAFAAWQVGKVIVVIEREQLTERKKALLPPYVIAEEAMRGEQRLCEVVDGNLPFYLGFTSGSTGVPKAFIRSSHSWWKSIDVSQRCLCQTAETRTIISGSLYHSLFFYAAVAALCSGGHVVLLEQFRPTVVRELVQDGDHVYVVPTMIEALCQEAVTDCRVTFVSSGAQLRPATKQKLKAVFPASTWYEFYGASELSFVTVRDGYSEAAHVGQPCPYVTVKVGAPREVGQVYVKSELSFDGYLHNEAANREVWHGEWLTVGDYGYVDEAGYLYLLGREKEMMNIGGVNVFPAEIEHVICAHPNVQEAVVFSRPHPYWGEVAVVVVTLVNRQLMKETKRQCEQQLPVLQRPRAWRIIDDMPLTESGKIARNEVKQRWNELVSWRRNER